MSASLQGTMVQPDPGQELAALLAQRAQQTAQAGQQATQAGQEYQQATQAPMPDIGPLAAFLPALLGNVASVIGQNPTYQKQAGEAVAGKRESLFKQREQNLTALRDRYQQMAESASRLGNHEQEIQWRSKMDSVDKQYTTMRDKQKQDFDAGQAELDRKSAEKIAGSKQTGRDAKQDIQAINTLTDNIRQDPELKDFAVVRDQYTTGIDAAKAKDSAGDIILMRAVARATDPRTGVREEEYRTFTGAQGDLARLGVNLTTGMIGKGKLTDAGRAALLARMRTIHDRKKVQSGRSLAKFRKQADAYGIDPNLVLQNFEADLADDPTPTPTKDTLGIR